MDSQRKGYGMAAHRSIYLSKFQHAFLRNTQGLPLTLPYCCPVKVVPLSMAELQGTLPVLAPSSTESPSEEEKAESDYVDTPGKEEAAFDSNKTSYGDENVDENLLYVNGVPVITTGRDVSKYLVDLRDDEDPPVTFRSVLLGTVIGGLGAAVSQVCLFNSKCL